MADYGVPGAFETDYDPNASYPGFHAISVYDPDPEGQGRMGPKRVLWYPDEAGNASTGGVPVNASTFNAINGTNAFATTDDGGSWLSGLLKDLASNGGANLGGISPLVAALPFAGAGALGYGTMPELGTVSATAAPAVAGTGSGYITGGQGLTTGGVAGGVNGGLVGTPGATATTPFFTDGGIITAPGGGVVGANWAPESMFPGLSTVLGVTGASKVLQMVKDGALPAAALKNLTSTGIGALQKLVSGNASAADIASLLGAAAPAALGAVASAQQASQFRDLYNESVRRYEDAKSIGAPSRARYEGSFAPGFSMESDPGYKDALDQTAKATLHGLSVTGNPATSPNAWKTSLEDIYKSTAYPALLKYRDTNATTGGYSAFNSSAATGPNTSAANSAIGADANVFNSIGAGISDVINPKQSLADLLKSIQGSSSNNVFAYA